MFWGAKVSFCMLAIESLPDVASTTTQVLPGRDSRWTARNLLAAGLLLAFGAALGLAVDVPVANYVRNHAAPKDLRHCLAVAEVFAWGPTVALLVLTAVVLDPRAWRIAPPLAIAAAAPGLLADGIKLLIARCRPGVAFARGDIEDTFMGWLPLMFSEALGQPYSSKLQSFPSGHAAVATGLALGLGTLYPRGRWLFLVFAALAMLQRIDAQMHFVSDLLAGGALAFFCAAASHALAGARPSSAPFFLGCRRVSPQP
jgi:membrane-associated phospholipid phosphatase